MALPQWPFTRRVSQNGFTYTFAEGRLKTAIDAGPPKMRRRFSAAVRLVAAQYEGPLADMTRLEQFWSDDTKGGTLPFLMPDQTLLSAGPVPTIPTTSAIGTVGWWLAMFGDSPPQIGAVGGTNYRASFALMLLP